MIHSGQYPHGNYYLKELAVPDGWKLSTQKFPVVLTSANKAANENTIVVKLAEPILNELIYIPVTITKTDITGAEKLPGALIEVYDKDGNVIYKEYTDKNGELPDIPVVPGTYTFKDEAQAGIGDAIAGFRNDEAHTIDGSQFLWIYKSGSSFYQGRQWMLVRGNIVVTGEGVELTGTTKNGSPVHATYTGPVTLKKNSRSPPAYS